MFELWKDDMSRVRLDENSQASGYLGKFWCDRTAWSDVAGVAFPYSNGAVAVDDRATSVMFGTTDGQYIGITSMTQAAGYKVLNLVAPARAGFWVYAFGPRNVTISNSGLQLLDISGNVTFDSGAKFLRIAGIQRGVTAGTEYSNPSGVPALAAGMSHTGSWIQRNQVGQFQSFIFFVYGMRVSTATTAIAPIPRQGPINEFPPSSTPAPAISPIIFADVTSY
jgi:hypothetical protein